MNQHWQCEVDIGGLPNKLPSLYAHIIAERSYAWPFGAIL
jgi:hypothetical protein